MQHSEKTLNSWSKQQIIKHCMCLEHNNKVLNESFERQYQNCMKIVEDMNLLNDTYKNRRVKLDDTDN